MEYVQESGRAGRNGNSAKASLYYTNREFGTRKARLTKSKASKREFEELQSMRTYCENTKKCRRYLLIAHFDGESEASAQCKDMDKHKCCDVCLALCTCDMCTTEKALDSCSLETASGSLEKEIDVKAISVSAEQKLTIKQKRLEYRSTFS